MLTISRRSVQRIRAVMHRALGTRGPGPAVCFTVASGMLNVKAATHDIAVEYSEPATGPDESLWLPSQFLDDCQGKRDEPIHVERTGKQRATAQWRDGSVPQIVKYDSAPPRNADKFPTLPEVCTANPPSLLQAFSEASETADPGSVRYALGDVRLRGEEGSLAATDGRQLLVQKGFDLPWTGDVLVPRTKVFTAPELPGDQPVHVGRTKDWVSFGIGPWYVHLRIDEQGRFPNIEQIIRSAEQAVGVCRFSAADVTFLNETLPRLPMDRENDNRVTLDLNGQVILRAKTAEQAQPTEVILSGSSWSGEPVRMNVNCRQITRALRLGLTDLYIYGDEAPVSWLDGSRTYLSSPLPKDGAIEPVEGAIRIESPANVSPSVSPPPKPKSERKVQPVNESVTHTNGTVTTNGNGQAGNRTATNGQSRRPKAKGHDIAVLIEQAAKLRAALHEHMHEAGELVKALKAHRRQSRAVEQTLDQLRSLKGLGV